MRKSEERLRTLHPYAMTRYDRLRAEGASPTKAGELRRASKERVRQESIRRDQKRDHSGLNGWRSASR